MQAQSQTRKLSGVPSMPLVSVPKSKNNPNANRITNAENDADLYENNKAQQSNPQANKPKPKSSATRIGSPSANKQTSTPITQKKVISEDSPKSFDQPQQQQQQKSNKSKNENFRLFIALFDYDPFKMSPNTDSCQEELPFKEGQVIKIFGEQDADGFYYGETNGKFGYIPCNMVSEVQVNDPDVVKQLLNDSNTKQNNETQKQRNKNSSSSSFSSQNNAMVNTPSKSKTTKTSTSSSSSKNQVKEQSFVPINNYQYSNSKPGQQSNQNMMTMIALYDYDPQSLSPNADADVGLNFWKKINFFLS